MGQTALKAKLEPEELSPVQRLERLFGGRKHVAQIANLGSDAIKKWGRPVSKGGQGGLVPSKFHMAFLLEARRRGLSLRAADLIGEAVQ